MAVSIRSWRFDRAGSEPNPQSLPPRAQSWAAAAARSGRVSLLCTREDDGLSSFMVGQSAAGLDDAALHLAQAVSSRAVEVEEMPELASAYVGELKAKRGGVVRATQFGSDPSEMARRLATVMRRGQWLAVSVRPPMKRERRRVKRWYDHRLGAGSGSATHHSSERNSVVASVFAGGDDKDQVRALLEQASAAFPGFDVETRVSVPSLAWACAPWAAASVMMWALGMFLLSMSVPALVASAILGLVAAGVGASRVPSRASRLNAAAALALLPVPPKRVGRPSKPRKARTTRDGDFDEGDEGAYPLASNVFPMSAAMAAALVVPHHGTASSGGVATQRREAPAALLAPIGPAIGHAGEGSALVHLSAKDLWRSVFVAGQAGSGKSMLLRAIWGWACHTWAHGSDLEGWPGRKNSLIAFESKGEGATEYLAWAEAMGVGSDGIGLVEVGDPSTFAIDMFDTPGSPVEKAEAFVNAMRYAFGEQAIGDMATPNLTTVIAAGLVVDDEVRDECDVKWQSQSPIHYAWILSGAEGDDVASRLASAILKVAKRREAVASEVQAAQVEADTGMQSLPGVPGDESVVAATGMGAAANRLRRFFGPKGQGMTPSQRRTELSSSQTKLVQLASLDSWWSPSRPKVSWRQLLDANVGVVLNTGVTTGGVVVPEKISQVLSAMLLFTLQEEVKRTCSGWQAQGRALTVFADELSDLAADSSEVIEWMRNKGRSFGVQSVLATQYPEQLRDQVRAAVLGFETFLWFRQTNPQIAKVVAEGLSMVGEDWTVADVVSLEQFTAIVQTVVDGSPQQPVPVSIPFWESDRAGFAEAQGLVRSGGWTGAAFEERPHG